MKKIVERFKVTSITDGEPSEHHRCAWLLHAKSLAHRSLHGHPPACEEAGARCVYPVRAPDADAVRTLLNEPTGPINVIAHPSRAMGVHRVSFGPFLQMTLTESITDLVTPWIT